MTDSTQRSDLPAQGSIAEIKPGEAFRIATDRSGDWYVWRRLSARSWVTFQRCDSEAEAKSTMDSLVRARSA